MSTPEPDGAARARPARAATGVAAFALVVVAGLLWAKWWPYAERLAGMLDTRAYPGSSVLDAAGAARSAPSVTGAWDFTVAYGRSVWPALVVALIVAAGVEAFVGQGRLLRVLGRDGTAGSLVGGLCSLPSMMCTCCTAPVAASLRRCGVPVRTALAYWVGNPALNPAVLAFLALVLPWEWFATRLAVGALLVFVATGWAARQATPADASGPVARGGSPAAAGGQEAGAAPVPLAATTGAAPVRFVRALARLAVTLLPEYLVVVFAIGLLRGWLLPLDGGSDWGALAVVVAAVLGTLVVIPTGGEIPVITGLLAAGVAPAVPGALLISLPAVSLVSMVMVGRAMTWRATFAMAGVVALAGMLSAGVIAALGS